MILGGHGAVSGVVFFWDEEDVYGGLRGDIPERRECGRLRTGCRPWLRGRRSFRRSFWPWVLPDGEFEEGRAQGASACANEVNDFIA